MSDPTSPRDASTTLPPEGSNEATASAVNEPTVESSGGYVPFFPPLAGDEAAGFAAPAAVATLPRPRQTPVTRANVRATPRASVVVRLFATLAVAAAVTTYVAVEVDLVRRHFPGVDPIKYWLPQVQQITLPGLGATCLFALLALGLHRLRRRA